MIETALLSSLLDILPAAALVLLGVSFLIRRHACRREEAELKESIRLFSQETDKSNEEGYGHE